MRRSGFMKSRLPAYELIGIFPKEVWKEMWRLQGFARTKGRMVVLEYEYSNRS